VQSFGALIAIDKRSQLICACSANVGQFLGKFPGELLGRPWSVVFHADHIGSLFLGPESVGQQLPIIRTAEFGTRQLLLASHSVGHTTLVEVEEWCKSRAQFEFADRILFLQALAATDAGERAAQLLMDRTARITGYDRVMLYRFLPDWHGEVIGEHLAPGVTGYQGLRFPASDLPANARRLYLVNWQRIIADVRAETVELLTQPDCELIDFSYSQLRAVHPVHIQYLKNIGVEASFSVSIVVNGRLWGLLACHHLAAKTLSLTQRQLCEELARTTGLHMSDMEAVHREKSRSGYREALAEILGALRSQSGNRRAIASQLAAFGQIFHAQGVIAHLDDRDFHSGMIPDDISLGALRNSLQNYDRSTIASRHTISPVLGAYPGLVRFASGTLFIPLLGEDYLLLLRSEQIETVRWAGKPQRSAAADGDILQLTPRASFQTWTEEARGSAEIWQDAELESAQRTQELLLEFIEKRELEDQALRDPLTGLANRLMFERALQEAVRLSIKDDMLAAVFMLDLDKFKAVNDTMGHAAGDELLVEVGKRLTGLMRARDTVARLGGDEFAIIAFDLQCAEDSYRTAERIIKAIRRPFTIQHQEVEVGVSIGVSMCPVHAIEQGELLEDADLALYEAKNAGRNTFKAFTHDMQLDSTHRDTVRNGLLAAMQNGEFFLVFQPIVSANSRSLQSFEAFSRWNHPVKGDLAAREFVPLLEQFQLMTQFANWGIRAVLEQGQRWMRKGLPLVPVSLNLAARQFVSLDLVGLCSALSREFSIGLEWLRFDLDETALQSDFLRVSAKVVALSELGILINIDHFGQGLVPLRRICEVKINQLKVAGQLFEASDDTTKSDALIAIVREVGRVVHVPIVASQIETSAMEMRAVAAGLHYLQGHLISRGLKPEEAEAWLRSRGSDEASPVPSV
jgi:diguanylate cyclase (GGDEF)-like protein